MIQIRRRTLVLAAVSFVVVAVLATSSLVLTLTRTAGAGGNAFSDTPPWIADHANWLAANDIANGYPDGTFRPNDDITRGQSAFWLGNYNDTLELVKHVEDLPGSGTGFGTSVFCPAGKRAVAGGHQGPIAPWVVQASYPNEASPRQWVIAWSRPDSAPIPEVTLWALCVPDTIDQP